MPYINVKVGKKLTDEKITELKAALGQAITAIPGKSEAYLMVCIEDDMKLWLAGDNTTPKAFVDVRILGKAAAKDYSKMTGEVCRILENIAGIAPGDVYAAYSEYEHWGHNGHNF